MSLQAEAPRAGAAALLRTRVEGLRALHGRLTGLRESACTRETALTERVSHAKGRLELTPQVDQTLDRLQQRAHERSVGAFERLLSAILSDVLPEKGLVKLALGTERSAPALDVQIDNAGHREDAFEGSGGAVTNVLSAGLRFAALSRTANRRFVVLDEPDCWLKPERVPAFIRVLAQVAEKARTQTVLISHHEPALFAGLVDIVRLASSCDGGAPKIIESHGHTWADEETPGIRSIRVVDFRLHSDLTLELSPGVTALIGDNDLGKSSLAVAALRAVAYGESDDTLIRHGANEARVEIRLEGRRVVEWVRRAKGNPRVMYALYEKGVRIHEGRPAARGHVPPWVNEALGIERVDGLDIQLANQKSPVFLLDEPPATRAQVLSVGREAGRLHALIEAYAELKRDDRLQVREGEAEVVALRARINATSQLSSLAKPIEELAQAIADRERAVVRLAQLGVWLARVDRIETRRLAAHRYASVLARLPADTPVLQETTQLSRLVQTIGHAKRIVGIRAGFPALDHVPQLPQLHASSALAAQLRTIEKTLRVAGLARAFPEPKEPQLSNTQSLAMLGARLARLSKRAALTLRVPRLPSEPQSCELLPLAQLISRVARRSGEKKALEVHIQQASDALNIAKEHLGAVIDSLGGVCSMCGGTLNLDSLVHAHGEP